MSATLLINSLSLIVSDFEGVVIGLDVSAYLAVDAGSTIPGLAPALHIVQQSGRTSSLTIQLVGRTLYYVGVIGQIICKWFPMSRFNQDWTCDFRVLYCNRWRIARSCDESFPRRGETTHYLVRLQLSSPELKFGSLGSHTHWGVDWLPTTYTQEVLR